MLHITFCLRARVLLKKRGVRGEHTTPLHARKAFSTPPRRTIL